jgi:tRNA (guanine-N7-)-methyltransferase
MADDPDQRHDIEFDLRSYGRRRGRKHSERQAALMATLLPQLAPVLSTPCPVPAAGLFANGSAATPAIGRIWLEIGFGGGEHLLWQARQNPDVGLIGCEPFEDGVVKVLSAIETERLSNIRLHADDARDLLRWLPEASVDRAFVLFPDPWPKRRHVKRRLLSAATLALLARVLKPGGELRIGTDIGDYARTILMAIQVEGSFDWIARRPHDWRERPHDWPATRYEQKAGREGRRCTFFRFVRSSET